MAIIGNPITLGGGGYATIVVEYPAGSTCTCSNGTKTFTAKDTSGTAVFSIPSNGLWAVTATDGTNTQSRTVTISYKGQGEFVYINYSLPTTYKRLEYIGTSGTQRVLMTLPASKDINALRYVADLVFQATTSEALFMGYTGGSYFIRLVARGGHLYPGVIDNGASIEPYDDTLFGKKIHYEAFGGMFSVDGNAWATASISSNNRSNFGVFYDSADTRFFSTVKLYYLAIYDTDGTTLLRELYPVMRLSDCVTGLYDTVSGTFFTNNGSGIFTFAEYGSGQ